MKKFLIPILLILWTMPATAQDDPNAILAKMDQILFSPKDKSGTLTMILIEKDGSEKVREAAMFQKGPDKKLYRYTKPESQAGIASLSLPGDVMWLYMPAFAQPKKISLLSRSQAFTGTDFSYEDMATTPYSDRFTPTIQSTGANDYVLELIPKSNKSSYTKILLRVDKTNGYPLWIKYYNVQNRMFKEATYTYEKIGKYWNAAEVVMKDLEKNHTTKIRLTNIKFDTGLTDDIFKVENLKQ